MNIQFAIDYIPRRMKELGFGDDYNIRWRHFQIDRASTLKVNAENEFFMLIDPKEDIIVKSKFGMFDVKDTSINEMQYEHRGKISITNLSKQVQLVLFIQVIPQHKK